MVMTMGRRQSEPGADRLHPFRSAVLVTRWATLTLSLILVIGDEDVTTATYAWLAAMVLNGVLRTFRPLRWRGTTGDVVTFVGGVILHAAAVCFTGYLSSPLIFALITHVVMAGVAGGLMASIPTAVGTAVLIGGLDLADNGYQDEDLPWIGLLILVALVASYGRRIAGEATRRQLVAMDRLSRLANANALLFSLHRVAQTLPASLDLSETIESTVARLRDLFDHDLATLLLFDETDQGWDMARVDGPGATMAELPVKIGAGRLPPPLGRAVAGGFLVQVADLGTSGGPGLWKDAGSGLYVLLSFRGSVVGLIALEHREPHHFDRRDIELLSGYVEPAALALDNARWFARLRTVGAEEERNRLARDLHDRIGQALAYLAFELDRLIRAGQRGDDVGPDLERLRDEVRRVVSEVRDTLYDLRTDVSESQDILAALRLVGRRLEARSGITVTVSGDPSGRLPLPQEREFFRIAQEAVVNVERHAQATTIAINWWSDDHAAILEVSDDGKGFPAGQVGRADSYGIVGMRERAASIGATLEIESLPGTGARVRCVRDEDRRRAPRTVPSRLGGTDR